MKKKILLINPWIYDFTAYDCWNKPLGLLYLAALLRMNGADVSVVDCLSTTRDNVPCERRNVKANRKPTGQGAYFKQRIPKPDPLKTVPRHYSRYGMTQDQFLHSVKSLPPPDIVMITSMMTYWYPAVFEIIQLVREALPGVPVVLGGNYVTLCPEHAAQSGAEFVLAGPAEQTIPRLWKALYNQDWDILPDDNDLDSYPYPAFDLLRHPDQLPIMASRGCPYRCSYCASHLLNAR